jgi:SET domain-containing protein
MSDDKTLLKLVKAKESQVHGMGLFAKTDIKKDTVIGTLKGVSVTEDGPHVLWMNDGKDKFKVENELRFINHHKKPNVAYYDDYTVVALKTIKAETELLHDYGDDWE